MLDETTGFLKDPCLDVRVLAVDPHFYKGLRKRLREVFPSGSDTILYEIGVGYGEQVGNVTVGEGRSKLSTYRDFVEKGRYQGWGSSRRRSSR